MLKFLSLIFVLLGVLFAGAVMFYKNEKNKASSAVVKDVMPVSLRGQFKPEVAGAVDESAPIDLVSVSAKSVLVYKYPSNQIIVEKNSDQKSPIASITKLVSVLTAFDFLNSGQIIKASVSARGIAPEIGINLQDEFYASDLFLSMLVGSANDATEVIAYEVEKRSKQKFSKLMNDKALELEMASSHFDNPNGYDSKNNFSTAKDLARLTNHYLDKGYSMMYGRQRFLNSETKNRGLVKMSTNLPDIDSESYLVKTGHTEGSGDNIIAYTKNKNDYTVYIILGSKNREKDYKTIKSQLSND